MNPAGNLEGFEGHIAWDYREVDQTIVGVLLTYPDEDVARPIIRKIGYYHHHSGNVFNFYLPGYLAEGEWCNYGHEYAFSIEGTRVHFCEKWFVDFVEYFRRRMPSYRCSPRPELLIFNVYKGKIDYSHKIRVNLNELKNNPRIDFDDLFENIYDAARDFGTYPIAELQVQLGLRVVKDTLLDTLKEYLLQRFPIIRRFMDNRNGIYFD